MQGYAAFHLGLHCLPENPFGVSSIQRFNHLGRNVKTFNFLTCTFHLEYLFDFHTYNLAVRPNKK